MTEKDDDAVATVAGSARVRLGHSDLTVRPVGLGCMGMPQFYGRADTSESVETIRSAIDLGVNFLDTSDLRRRSAIQGRRERDRTRWTPGIRDRSL